MPRKSKSSIGRKRKGHMHRRSLSPSSPSSPSSSSSLSSESSNKRHRKKHHRRGTHIPAQVIAAVNEYGRNPSERSRVYYRMAIYYYYVEVLDAPHLTHWRGNGGTITIIRKALGMMPYQRRVIKRTLLEIMRCAVEGIIFDGRIESKNKTGRKIIILPGSAEELLIANWMENHCGFRMTTYMVNEHRRQEGKDRVSVYCVMAAFYRLKPKVNVLVKVQSGGNNEGWIRARYNQAKQVEAMLGNLTEDEMMTDITGNYLYASQKLIFGMRKIIIYHQSEHITNISLTFYFNP